jgi:hypothetical protein
MVPGAWLFEQTTSGKSSLVARDEKDECKRRLIFKERSVCFYINDILTYGFLKEPVAQTHPNTAFIAFVGHLSLLECHENTVWTLVHANKHASPPGMINSFDNNQHTFNIAKYYKCQAYKCPELEDADIIVWLDGSVQITNPQCAEYIVEKLLAGSDMVA